MIDLETELMAKSNIVEFISHYFPGPLFILSCEKMDVLSAMV